jgi:hypothetical protein
VAPYATPLTLASTGINDRIYYKSFGASPNQFFVVEWYHVVYGDDSFTYEIVLYENGDIDFNYQTISIGGSEYYCGISGIENMTGEDGLNNIDYCDLPTSSTSIHFTRPTSLARVKLTPSQQSKFLRTTDEFADFSVTVNNTGDLGSDLYDITSFSFSPWPISYFESDGVTPLTDTGGNSNPDTGVITQGGEKEIIIRVDLPDPLTVGMGRDFSITFTSSLNTGRGNTILLGMAVPYKFAQVFMGMDTRTENINLIQPFAGITKEISDNDEFGSSPAIVETGDGFFLAWSRSIWHGTYWTGEIITKLVDHAGFTLRDGLKLTDHSSAVSDVYDGNQAVAVAPNGMIGVMWSRTQKNGLGQTNSNLYLATFDQAGLLASGPTNLTGNTNYGFLDTTYNVPFYYHPQIAATDDNRFILSWQHAFETLDGEVSDIYYSIRETDNSILVNPTKLTNDTAGGLSYRFPSLTDLTGNRFLISYAYDYITYAVLSSSGSIVKVPPPLTYPGEISDAVQLSTGNIVLAFEQYVPTYYGYLTSFALLDGSLYGLINYYSPFNEYTTGEWGISLAADQAGNAIIVTYEDRYPTRRMYYSLFNGTGTYKTVMYEMDPAGFDINTNGYSITSYSWTPAEGVDLAVKSQELILGKDTHVSS